MTDDTHAPFQASVERLRFPGAFVSLISSFEYSNVISRIRSFSVLFNRFAGDLDR